MIKLFIKLFIIGKYIIRPLGDWQLAMKQNYRTKLGLGYEEAKFNYL